MKLSLRKAKLEPALDLNNDGLLDIEEPKPVMPPRRRFWSKRLAGRIAAGLLVIVFAVGGYVGFKFVHNAGKALHGNIFSIFSDAKLNGEAQGRVNILLAGDSEDDPGHGGGQLTDSIMIASINTKNNTAFTLSIPRDLWVNVPGHGHERINAAYEQGGASLLERVIADNFGVTVNYYAVVDYTAFKQAVTTVGGIQVNIQSSDPRGIYDPNISKADKGPLILKNGLQTLDGQTALNLARARNDPTPTGQRGYGLPGGDFDRATNQRLMLSALAAKATSLSTLANPVKLGQLLDAIGNNVHTDLTAGNLHRLYSLSKTIKSSSIESHSLDKAGSGNINLLANYTGPNGESVLIPAAGVDDFSKIQRYLTQLTSTNSAARENATIEVLNGSGISGAAAREQAKLTTAGYDVIGIGTVPTAYPATVIIDGSDGNKPATLAALKKLYGITATTTSNLAQDYTADFVIVLGQNTTKTNN